MTLRRVPWRRRPARTVLAAVAAAAVAVAVASVVVVALEQVLAVPNAAAVYLVGVAAVAIAAGTSGAVLTAILAVVVYDFFFTDPRHTLVVADPGEWLNLLLLLFVAVTVGELAALQRRRAELAEAREREARALVEVTRALATRDTARGVLGAVAATLAREAELDQMWVALGADDATERTVATAGGPRAGGPTTMGGPATAGAPVPTTAPAATVGMPAAMGAPAAAEGTPPRRGGAHHVLRRGAGTEPPSWTQVRSPTEPPTPHLAERRYRVRLEAGGQVLGSIWGTRPVDAGPPSASATRLLAATADQVAQALAHDALAGEARRAEIARQSDRLKSALLEAVSHDLRTPLASIRAYAGTLMDGEVRLDPEEARASAAAIDREAQRLNRIVANLLDLGRIEGGALRATVEALDVEDVVASATAHASAALEGHPLTVDVSPGTAVLADAVLLEQVLVNLLENAGRHTPAGTAVRLVAAPRGGGTVRLTVEDGGPGVPAAALPRLFDTFYRVPARAGTRTGGTGLGLAVVRGFVQAVGGDVGARPSDLGGLAIDVDLPAAVPPASGDAAEVGR